MAIDDIKKFIAEKDLSAETRFVPKMLNQTGAGNHVAMIKAMALMASLVGEDPGHSGSNAGGAGGGSLYDHTDFSKY